MSATEDESQSLDAGWDDAAPSAPGEDAAASAPGEDEIDQAWDSMPPPVSSASASSAPSSPPATEEVDSGWDDVPAGAPGLGGEPGKRRPHRQRRPKANVALVSSSPVLSPRPAEPTKKHQREHARKQRAQAAQAKHKRKEEKKAERAAEAREEAAARLRQREADEQARRELREARAREQKERVAARPATKPAVAKPAVAKPAAAKSAAAKASSSLKAKEDVESARSQARPQSALRPGVILALLALVVVGLVLVLRK